jgi:hypothetical protein
MSLSRVCGDPDECRFAVKRACAYGRFEFDDELIAIWIKSLWRCGG